MKITWQADDGYVGGGRPQTCKIPDDEIDECESQEDFEKLVSDYIDQDLQNKVHAVYDMPKWPEKKNYRLTHFFTLFKCI